MFISVSRVENKNHGVVYLGPRSHLLGLTVKKAAGIRRLVERLPRVKSKVYRYEEHHRLDRENLSDTFTR